MKKSTRISKLENEIIEPGTNIERLVALGEQWLEAVKSRKWSDAVAISEDARIYLTPDLIDSPPAGEIPKVLFINWSWFVNFNKSKVHNAYRECVKNKISPNYKFPKINTLFS